MSQLIQDILQFLADNKDLIDTLTNLLTAVAIPLGGLIAILAWFIRQRRQRRLRINVEVFDVVSKPQSLLPRLYGEENETDSLAHHNILYQARSEEHDIQTELRDALGLTRYLLITGRKGIGKTREAALLARSLMYEGYRVVLVRAGWLDVPNLFPPELQNDPRRIILFLDDLNGLFRTGDFAQSPHTDQALFQKQSSYRDRLLKVLDAFEDICGKEDFYVIATARNEVDEWKALDFNPKSALWKKFTVYELTEPDNNSVVRILQDTVKQNSLQANPQDFPGISQKNDGTYMNVILNLRRLRATNKPVNLENYTATLDGSWREVYERTVKEYPAVKYIYDAIEALRKEQIPLFPINVMFVTLSIAGEGSISRFLVSLGQRRRMARALKHSYRKKKLFGERDGQLVIYDGQIEAKGYHTTYTLSPQLRTLLSSTYNLSSAIGWFPGLPLVIFGAILMQMKRKERAAKIFKKVTTLVPQGAPAWRLYAQSLHALERYDEAEVAYRQSIRCDPQYPGAYLWLSFLLKESERHDEAEEILKQLIKQKPSAYYTYLLLGMYVQERGRLTDAEQLFEKAIKLNPKDAGSYTLLGGNLLEQKRLIEAEEVLLKALKLKHKKSDIRPLYNAFGDAYMEQRELDKARSYFNKRIQLEPKTAFDALVSLGIIAYFEGDKNDDGYFLRALDIWDVSWKVQRQTPAGLLENKALALACLDRQEEALQALEEAISRWSWEDVVELHRYELLLDTPNPPEGIEKMVNTLRTLALEHNPGQ